MPFFAIAFLCGVVLLQCFSTLPSHDWLFSSILLALGPWFLRKRFTKFISISLIGFAWCLWYAEGQIGLALPHLLEGKNLIATGTVASLPDIERDQTTFLFALKTLAGSPRQGKVHLSFRHPKAPLHAGETWALTVRLKKIHSTFNPNGFDYEAWAFQEGIIASGYVVNTLPAHLLQTNRWHPVDHFRQWLRDKLEASLPRSPTSHWIIALALGERMGVSAAEWQVLRNTGTNHLMAIAGLHIGFLSAFIYALFSWTWRRLPRVNGWFPAQQVGAIAALIASLMYGTLAGFSLPTARACWMVAFFLMMVLLRRHVLAWQALSMALIAVLVINPLCVLEESFWLSFASVALIIYAMNGRLRPQGVWWQHGRLQWALGFGLVPFNIGFFHQCSLVSFIANSMAVPLLGFGILPLVLGGCFLLLIAAPIGIGALSGADHLLQLLWGLLRYLAGTAWGTWYQSVPDHWMWIAACIGVVILLVPSGFPGRWLGLFWTLPLLLYQAPVPRDGQVWFTLLDVGQGLAAVVQTKQHILVFDTGEKLNDHFDMGDSVVVPFLHAVQAKKVDVLVISHGDNDHLGGMKAILQQIAVRTIKTSVKERLADTGIAEDCLRGDAWEWDGVQFAFLYPVFDHFGLGNDSSCVLRISVGQQSILLTGDIEKAAERYLIQSNTQPIESTILVAPHHGSKTSALNAFIDQVAPKIVLFPIGYRNRYHFPHPTVVAQYKRRGTLMYDSVRSGAIQFFLSDKATLPQPLLYRVSHQSYWQQP